MFYLDDSIDITVDSLTITASTVYVYEVRQYVNYDWSTIFVGRCWLTSGDTSHEFHINEILANVRDDQGLLYKGPYPSLNTTNLISAFNVRINLGTEATPVWKSASNGQYVMLAYRYPNRKEALEKSFNFKTQMGDTYVQNMLQGSLLPRVPFTLTDNFDYEGMWNFNINRSPSYYVKADGIAGVIKPFTPPSVKGTTLYKESLHHMFQAATTVSSDDPKLALYYNLPSTTGDVWTDEDTETATYGDEGITKIQEDLMLTQPVWLGIYAGSDEGQMLMGLTSEALWRTTSQHYSAQQVVNFDNFPEDERVISILLEAGGSSYSLYELSNDTLLTGQKTVKFIFDYQYEPTQALAQCGLMSNIQIQITSQSQTVKVFDIASIDVSCARAKYYLQWQDRYGGIQSQPFDKVSEYSEGVSTESIKNYKDEKRYITTQITPRWKINTGWLDETVYPYYESIFTSPYLRLYDFNEDKSYVVNITDTEYVEKTFTNNQRKLFNLTLNLENNKIQNITH